ncbi:hypothetical protein E2C01_046525 [Portunus trituberculatus]|uniref:Uncharacterized protein n=1 Tax=Portunus trituberculatus TaxID=210409 RepID=A0A5B7G508_PORTR|nr:hypothetical protein [Portunus trituberculatus]
MMEVKEGCGDDGRPEGGTGLEGRHSRWPSTAPQPSLSSPPFTPSPHHPSPRQPRLADPTTSNEGNSNFLLLGGTSLVLGKDFSRGHSSLPSQAPPVTSTPVAFSSSSRRGSRDPPRPWSVLLVVEGG